MRKLILILCIVFTFDRVSLAPEYKTLIIEQADSIRPYERITEAIAMVESSKDDSAYNPLELATGRYQIRPIKLKDYNQRTRQSYSLRQMHDPIISKKIILYYVTQYDYRELQSICKIWNGKGKGNKEYLIKVKKQLRKG